MPRPHEKMLLSGILNGSLSSAGKTTNQPTHPKTKQGKLQGTASRISERANPLSLLIIHHEENNDLISEVVQC